MLTTKQNLLETIRGGNPERFVNCYEPFELIVSPVMFGIGGFAITMTPGTKEVDGWGVTVDFPSGFPGPMPVHNDETTVLKDITKWKDIVKAPNFIYSDEDWAQAEAAANAIDRNDKFVTAFYGPGIFERVHYLLGMEEALIDLYEEPEAMHELIDFIADWEIEYAKEYIKHVKPDALFHHDDFGSQISSLISPDMFNEFIVPAYKKVYSFFKENGCLIIHHSDSYAANLVPGMIEMGVDIWQGVLTENNIPDLIKQYGGKISFMGGINNGVVDKDGWTQELISTEVERACTENGKLYFIPCTTMGGPDSIFPGVYAAAQEEVNNMSSKMF